MSLKPSLKKLVEWINLYLYDLANIERDIIDLRTTSTSPTILGPPKPPTRESYPELQNVLIEPTSISQNDKINNLLDIMNIIIFNSIDLFVIRDNEIIVTLYPLIDIAMNIFNVKCDELGYLDIGCGSTFPTYYFAKMLKTSPVALDFKNRNMFYFSSPMKNDKYLVLDTLNFCPEFVNKESMTLITIVHVLSYVNQPFVLLYEAFKALKPGGVMIILDYFIEESTTTVGSTYPLDVKNYIYAWYCHIQNRKTNYLPSYTYHNPEQYRNYLFDLGLVRSYTNADNVSHPYGMYYDLYYKPIN